MTAALSVVAGALARGVAPIRHYDPVEWGEKTLVVPDGPYQGQYWDSNRTPYLKEILQHLSPESPVNRVTVRASAQIGKTITGLLWAGYVVDVCPAHMLIVFPTIKALYDFNSQKLQGGINSSPRLKSKMRSQKSRAGESSTTFTKRFEGGSIVLVCANSAPDLRSKTAPYVFCDEIDEWPKDLDHQGDPMKMVDARQLSFRKTGNYKKLECSTPTIEEESRIDESFQEGDQRYWQMPCPECGEYQRLVFSNLKFQRQYPFNAHYACEHNGCVIEEFHKPAMLAKGKWVASVPGPGRHPSYHIDTLFSPFVAWDDIAKEWWDCQEDREKLKGFLNLWLGESFKVSGEAPDWQRLMGLREAYMPRRLPAGALLITGGADVQKNGIYYESLAWGPGKTNWSIEIGFLPGNTEDEADAVWHELDEVRRRQYPDAYGNLWGIDAFGIDTQYRTGQAVAWTRRWPSHSTYALRGVPGWYHPPIGTPAALRVDAYGKKNKRGEVYWPVGTYKLKDELYANLRKKGRSEGAPHDPPGYCHFAEWHDERYFKQLTAEHVEPKKTKTGLTQMEWVLPAKRDNHFLDCRVYAMAMAERLIFNGKVGLTYFGEDDWRQLAAIRSVPPARMQEDLFDRMGVGAPLPKAAKASEAEKPKPKPGGFVRQPSNLRF